MSISNPFINIFPQVFEARFVRILIVVDFPAQLYQSKAKKSQSSISRFTHFKTSFFQ